MSGPKTSRYTLTAEQRRRIAEQQRIEREIQMAQNKKENLRQKCSCYMSDLDRIVTELEKICAESGMGKEELIRITASIKAIQDEISRRAPKTVFTESLDILTQENQVLEKRVSGLQEQKEAGSGLLKLISSKYKSQLSTIIAGGFELSFQGLGAERRIKDNLYIKRINDALAQIEGVDLPTFLVEKFKIIKQRAEEITNLDFLENFCSMQVYPFVNECKFYMAHIGEFEELQEQYKYLANELKIPVKLFPFSEENIERLEEEIDSLEQTLLSIKEQEYISHTIDEVMLEMGYELIGEKSIVKKSGKKFRTGLYALEEGTAVNVTFAESGQISMELGALGSDDRTPSESEAAELVEDMRAFCEDYSTLEQKLAERGITAKRVAILPPKPEYAQVFNTHNYEMKKSVADYKKDRKKASTGKEIHKEG